MTEDEMVGFQDDLRGPGGSRREGQGQRSWLLPRQLLDPVKSLLLPTQW